MEKEYSKFEMELTIKMVNYDLNDALNKYVQVHTKVFDFSLLKFWKIFRITNYGLYLEELTIAVQSIIILNETVFKLRNTKLKEDISFNENAYYYFEVFSDYTSSLLNAINDLILIVNLLQQRSEGIKSNQTSISNYNRICNEYERKVEIYKSIGKKLNSVSQNTLVEYIN